MRRGGPGMQLVKSVVIATHTSAFIAHVVSTPAGHLLAEWIDVSQPNRKSMIGRLLPPETQLCVIDELIDHCFEAIQMDHGEILEVETVFAPWAP
jgi:hypothetical protein